MPPWRLLISLFAAALLIMGGLAQPGPAPRPAARFSPNVCIIILDGEIDAVTSVSVRRRLAEARDSNADAVVVQINSPGGEVGAVLEITSALKQSPIPRTVAWVNPTAHSGGAIVALACGEIVTAGGASFGDAAPVMMGFIMSLSETERAKILSPLLADIVGSARRAGYDEKLAQGMVTLGVELWLVENAQTGERIAIDRREYAILFDGDPVTSTPRLVGTPIVPGLAEPPPPKRRRERTPPIDRDAGPPSPFPASAAPASAAEGSQPTDLLPASPRITPATAREASMALTVPSLRPIITPAEKGKWKLVEYLADGTSLYTFTDADLLDLRIASARINNESELRAWLGATSVIRLTPAWYEAGARFLGNMWVRGLLIVVVILGLFIEFIHPGLVLPASAAGLAVLALLLPEILMGLAGWWEAVLIIGGVVLIGVELLLTPGLGIPGAIGLLSLLAGLVLAFVPAAAPSFPGSHRSSSGLLWGVGFVAIGLATAAAVGYYMSRNMRTLPVLGRLVLRDRPRDEDLEGEAPLEHTPAAVAVERGELGVAITTLRPSGKADFSGKVIDVVSDGPMILAGTPLRVSSADQFRVTVEPVDRDPDRVARASARG